MMKVFVLAACLIAAGLLGAVAISLSSRGHPVVLPLDDAYIYLQYAHTSSAGSIGEYTPGAGITTGATGLLWSGLLTIAAWGLMFPGGLDAGILLPLIALILCAVGAALSFFHAYRLATRHGAGSVAAWIPALLCILTPYWFFGSFNGMETGWYGAVLLGGAWAAAGGSAWWLLPLALTRPEGAGFAVVLLVLIWIRDRRNPNPETGASLAAAATGIVLAALVTLLAPYVLTGEGSSAWTAKALWTEPDPDIRGFYIPRLPYFLVRTLWFGLTGGRPQPPLDVVADLMQLDPWSSLGWVVFLGGGAGLAVLRRRSRVPLLLWVCVSASALLAVSWDAQFYRYLIPGYTLLCVTAAAGWFGIRDSGWGRLRTALGTLSLAALITATVTGPTTSWSTVRWLYRGESERMAETQIRVGKWLDANLSADKIVATHDVGAIAFVGQRRIVDLVGLVTRETRGAYRHGEGALWETLDALPRNKRPTHAAVIPAWIPYLSRTLWSGKTVWALGENNASRGPVSRQFEVWELSWPGEDVETWPGEDLGNQPRWHGRAAGRPGWEIVDEVDIADLGSERGHDYLGETAGEPTVVRNLGFAGRSPAEKSLSAMEGGRDILGPVEFRVRVRPGVPALLVLRSASPRPVRAVVHVGDWSGTLEIPRGEILFREPALLLPEEVLDQAVAGLLRIRVEGKGYRAFHWWVLQP